MIAALLLAFQAPAAAPPAKPTVITPAEAEARAKAQLRQLGMSEAGLETLKRMSTPDPDAGAIRQRLTANRQKMREMLARQPLDVDAFVALLKTEAQIEGQVRVRLAERLGGVLRALSPADREIYARLIAAQAARRTQATAQ